MLVQALRPPTKSRGQPDKFGQKKQIYIPNVAGKHFGEIYEKIASDLGLKIQVEHVRSNTTKTSTGFSVAIKAIGGNVGLENSSSERTIDRPVKSNVGPEEIYHICDSRNVILVLDEIHRANSDFIKSLAVMIKSIKNMSLPNFRVILLGTASSSSDLVGDDPGVDRILQEVHVKRLSNDECSFLISKGMHDLQIDFSDADVDSLTRRAVGSPYILQYLCLGVAEEAFERSPRKINAGDIKIAVNDYIKTRAKRLEDTYRKAISRTGTKRYRTHILHAMAMAESDYVTMEKIRQYVSSVLGEDVPSTALSGPLRELKKDDYGKVLKDVERHGGERVYDYTTFSDPAMKAVIRILLENEES